MKMIDLALFILNRYFILFFVAQLIYFGFVARKVPVLFKIILFTTYMIFVIATFFPLLVLYAFSFDAPGSKEEWGPYLFVPCIGLILWTIPGIIVNRIMKKPRY